MADSCCHRRLCGRGIQHTVFLCVKGSYQLPQGQSVDFLSAAALRPLHCILYDKLGKDDGGTNQVLSTVRSQDDVPWLSGPLIFVSTALTHLTGGSAGREGAAIQLGGSIANLLGRWIHLDEEDRHVIVMCGMSAAFSALFGIAYGIAAVFSMEVVSVGVMYYTALMPCMIASLIASRFAAGMGVTPESFHVVNIPAFNLETGLKMGVAALGCAVISIVFCIILNETARLYGKFFPNKIHPGCGWCRSGHCDHTASWNNGLHGRRRGADREGC